MARVAAAHAPGLEPEAVQPAHGDLGFRGPAFELDAHRGAASIAAVPNAPRHEGVLAHEKRRLDLDVLDRGALQVADHGVRRIDAVSAAAAARAAGERLHDRGPVASALRVGPSRADDAGLARSARRDPAGNRLVKA